MKTQLLASLLLSLLVPSFAFAGFTLHCKLDEELKYTEQDANAGLVFAGGDSFVCKGPKKKMYAVEFGGIGPSLNYDWKGSFVVSCPLVRKSKIEQAYVGLRALAAAGAGVTTGLAFNKRLGICFVSGVLIAAGGAAQIAKLEIREIKAK